MHKSKLHCIMNWVEMCISFSAKKKKKDFPSVHSPSDRTFPTHLISFSFWSQFDDSLCRAQFLIVLLYHFSGTGFCVHSYIWLFCSPAPAKRHSYIVKCAQHHWHRCEGCVYYCSMCTLGEPLQCLLCKLQKETSSQRNSPWLHVSPALFGLSSAHREWEQPGKQSPTPHRVQLDVDISSQSWQDTSVPVATSMCTDRGICTASSPNDTDSELGSYFEGMLSDILGAQLWIAVEKPWCHLRSLSPGTRSTQLSGTQKSLQQAGQTVAGWDMGMKTQQSKAP